nr:diguanylate cyclase [Marinobacter changyiensis]
MRATDIVSRVGGEDFMVLLPNSRREAAVEVAENLRQTVSQTEFRCENDTVFATTISGGALEMTEGLVSVADLVERSDGNHFLGDYLSSLLRLAIT